MNANHSPPGDGDDDDDDCPGYSYVYIGNLDIFANAYWYYGGCYNDLPYYSANLSGTSWYVYRCAKYNAWYIQSYFSDEYSWAWCGKD